MKNISILAFLACVSFVGCQPAHISVASWKSEVNGGNAQTRCEQVDLRSKAEMDKLFPKYDGWKLIYLSEYTTGNKVGTDAAVCFERAK